MTFCIWTLKKLIAAAPDPIITLDSPRPSSNRLPDRTEAEVRSLLSPPLVGRKIAHEYYTYLPTLEERCFKNSEGQSEYYDHGRLGPGPEGLLIWDDSPVRSLYGLPDPPSFGSEVSFFDALFWLGIPRGTCFMRLGWNRKMDSSYAHGAVHP